MGIHQASMGLWGQHRSRGETHRKIRSRRAETGEAEEADQGGYPKAEPVETGTGPPEANQVEFQPARLLDDCNLPEGESPFLGADERRCQEVDPEGEGEIPEAGGRTKIHIPASDRKARRPTHPYPGKPDTRKGNGYSFFGDVGEGAYQLSDNLRFRRVPRSGRVYRQATGGVGAGRGQAIPSVPESDPKGARGETDPAPEPSGQAGCTDPAEGAKRILHRSRFCLDGD